MVVALAVFNGGGIAGCMWWWHWQLLVVVALAIVRGGGVGSC